MRFYLNGVGYKGFIGMHTAKELLDKFYLNGVGYKVIWWIQEK